MPAEDDAAAVWRPSRRRFLARADSLRGPGREDGDGDASALDQDLPPVGRDDWLAEAESLPERIHVAGWEHAVLIAAIRVHRVQRPVAVAVAEKQDPPARRASMAAARGEHEQSGQEREETERVAQVRILEPLAPTQYLKTI